MATILVVDDEPSQRKMLRELLSETGRVLEAENGLAALECTRRHAVDLVVSDIRMPLLDGLELQRRLRVESPDTAVILMTAYETVETAVRAMKEGAADYFVKGKFSLDEFEIVVRRTLEGRRMARESESSRDEAKRGGDVSAIIGGSPRMREVFDLVSRVARSEANVLVTGESGTGKELVASAIHFQSPRAERPFVKVNCGALAPTLVESELFGHVRGAFTGAVKEKTGRFALADTGTLFLDEIGELEPSTQVKLLRALQEGEFEPVGSDRTRRVDVRVIAATNRDLKAMIAAGRFREDLYYRLDVVRLELPPLRERGDDTLALADHFLARHARRHGKVVTGISDAARAALLRYRWPGNVRELANVIERAVVLARGDVIDLDALPADVTGAPGTAGDPSPLPPGQPTRSNAPT